MFCGDSHLLIASEQGKGIGSLAASQMDCVQGTKRDLRMTRRDNPISPPQNELINRHHPERSVSETALQFLPGR
jgi:hypothetical protein